MTEIAAFVDDGLNHTKPKSEFRNYVDSDRQDIVSNHYRLMRSNQTVDFVEKMHAKYSFASGRERAKMTVRQALKVLESYVDSSDPVSYI